MTEPVPDTDEDAIPDDDGEDVRQQLSGLHKARAPATFAQDVTATIHDRSAGRLFGRRTFGDRIPFGALLVVAVIVLAVVAWMLHARGAGPASEVPAGGGSGQLVPHP